LQKDLIKRFRLPP